MLLALATHPLVQPLLAVIPLLAQAGGEDEPEQGYNMSWGIVMLCVALGMMITLRVSKRSPIEDKIEV